MSNKQKIYTKTGDKGTTSLIGGKRIAKTDLSIRAYGTVDELSAQIGYLKDLLYQEKSKKKPVEKIILQLNAIQNDLYWYSAELAGFDNKKIPEPARIQTNKISTIEEQIDNMLQNLPPLKNFIIAGGNLCSSQAHIIRTVCRRCEIEIVTLNQEANIRPELISYINRLSDWFFALIRTLNNLFDVTDSYYTNYIK